MDRRAFFGAILGLAAGSAVPASQNDDPVCRGAFIDRDGMALWSNDYDAAAMTGDECHRHNTAMSVDMLREHAKLRPGKPQYMLVYQLGPNPDDWRDRKLAAKLTMTWDPRG